MSLESIDRSLGSAHGKLDLVISTLQDQGKRLYILEGEVNRGKYKQFAFVGSISGFVAYLTDWVHHGFK